MAAHDRIAALAHVKVIPFWGADHDLHAEQPEAFTDAVHTTIQEGFFG
jgi:bifunctional pyridoxal-dependent enzyme with beta-cystathionase and maltose regulon repressor activities